MQLLIGHGYIPTIMPEASESFAVLQKQYRKNMETIKCVREE